MLDVPEGRELSHATIGNGIAGALAGLELEDVRTYIESPVSTSVEFETWDGLKLSVEIVTADEADWLAFTATLIDEESAAGNEAATISERLTGWQYQIAEQKKNLLIRRWGDLLKSADQSADNDSGEN